VRVGCGLECVGHLTDKVGAGGVAECERKDVCSLAGLKTGETGRDGNGDREPEVG